MGGQVVRRAARRPVLDSRYKTLAAGGQEGGNVGGQAGDWLVVSWTKTVFGLVDYGRIFQGRAAVSTQLPLLLPEPTARYCIAYNKEPEIPFRT